MRAVSFDEANVLLRPAPGDEGEVNSISVLQTKDEQGRTVIVQCWEPTETELDEIVRTKRVWLIAYGETTPPLCVMGYSPLVDPPEGEEDAAGS